jgi:hypothetical protein
MHNRTAWSDYFTGSPTLHQQKLYETVQSFSSTNVHVLNCLFRSTTSTSDGGALRCTSDTYLLVESSSFFSCTTSSSSGGAIYFSNTNSGQCVLHEVCGYDCWSTYSSGSKYDQFAYLRVNHAVSSKNYVNYSSIARCVNSYSNSYYTMRFWYGKICCPSVNLSMNKCQYRSTVACYPFTGSFTYCSFVDNVANGDSCIYSGMGNTNIEFKNCNILRNTQGSRNSAGTIHTYDNMMFKNSCILENNANTIFYQASSYTITVSNCTVDRTSNNGCLTIQNTATKSFIFALNHMSTQNCHSEYDSAGHLTPNIQTTSSPSKKQIQCFTYGQNLCQPLIFHSVFIFNFIHQYASIEL